MTLTVFKLESFRAALPAQPVPVFDQNALDQAFADGLAKGIARQQDEQYRTLSAGLVRLASALDEDQARRTAVRQEAVGGLSAILVQILDCLVPAAESRRLQDALTQELLRLAHMAAPVTARISCGSVLRPVVDRCLTDAGLMGIEVVETEAGRISLSLEGGRIEIDPQVVAAEIRRLVEELSVEDASWTH